jgi:hypothetical protein
MTNRLDGNGPWYPLGTLDGVSDGVTDAEFLVDRLMLFLLICTSLTKLDDSGCTRGGLDLLANVVELGH